MIPIDPTDPLARLWWLCHALFQIWLGANSPAALPPALSAPLAAELERLEGHRVTVAADGAGYTIESVAGEGRPVVGVVERRGEHLMLVSQDGTVYRLAGPLARPRIAGPGYKVWVLGTVREQDRERAVPAPIPMLEARRLGILAPPR